MQHCEGIHIVGIHLLQCAIILSLLIGQSRIGAKPITAALLHSAVKSKTGSSLCAANQLLHEDSVVVRASECKISAPSVKFDYEYLGKSVLQEYQTTWSCLFLELLREIYSREIYSTKRNI